MTNLKIGKSAVFVWIFSGIAQMAGGTTGSVMMIKIAYIVVAYKAKMMCS